MEDDLNFYQDGRQPKLFLQMEDDLHFQPNLFLLTTIQQRTTIPFNLNFKLQGTRLLNISLYNLFSI